MDSGGGGGGICRVLLLVIAKCSWREGGGGSGGGLPQRFMMASRRTLWTDYTSEKMHAANAIKSTQLIAELVSDRARTWA